MQSLTMEENQLSAGQEQKIRDAITSQTCNIKFISSRQVQLVVGVNETFSDDDSEMIVL